MTCIPCKIGCIFFVFVMLVGIAGAASPMALTGARESPLVNSVTTIDDAPTNTIPVPGPTAAKDGTSNVRGASSSTVPLGEGSFSITAANSGQRYDVDKRTALGALIASGTSYTISDAYYSEYGSLFVESINGQKGQGTKGWMYQVNGGAPGVGANACTVGDGDRVVWYWSEGMSSTPETSSQVIRLTVAYPTTVPTTVKTTTVKTTVPTPVKTTAVKTTVPTTVKTTTVKTTVPTPLQTSVRTTLPTTTQTSVQTAVATGTSVTSSNTELTPAGTGPTQIAAPATTPTLPVTGTSSQTTQTTLPVTSTTYQVNSTSVTSTSAQASAVAIATTDGYESDAAIQTPSGTPVQKVTNTTAPTVSATGIAVGGTANATPAANVLGNGSTPNGTTTSARGTTPPATGIPTTARSTPVPPMVAVVAVVLGTYLVLGSGRRR